MERITGFFQRKPDSKERQGVTYWYNPLPVPDGLPKQAEIIITRDDGKPQESMERLDVYDVIGSYMRKGYGRLAQHSQVIFDFLKGKGYSI